MISYYITPDNDARTNAVSHIVNMHPDKSFQVTIKDKIDGKTERQRNYWHAIIDVLVKLTGHEKDYFKRYYKTVAGYTKKFTYKDGTVSEETTSSEYLNKEQYAVLIDMAQATCQELGLEYPPPRHYGEY